MIPVVIILQAIGSISLKNTWMILNSQTVGGLTVYCVDAFTMYNFSSYCRLIDSFSLQSKVDDIVWLDIIAVDCVLYRCISHMRSYFMISVFFILQAYL